MNPNTSSTFTYPASFHISVKGISINEYHNHVQQLTVQLHRGQSGSARIVFNTFRDESGRWLVEDKTGWEPWDTIKISAIFNRTKKFEILSGVIRNIQTEYPQDMSAAKVIIDVQDDLIKLDREQLQGLQSSQQKPKSDSRIAEEYARMAGLKSSVASNSLTATTLQMNSTPIKLLQERAQVNGFELYVREGTLYFKPPQLSAIPQKKILVYAGAKTNCTEFNINQDGHRPEQVRLIRDQRSSNTSSGNSPNDSSANSDSDNASRNQAAWETRPNQTLLGKRKLTSDNKSLRPFTWLLDRPPVSSDSEARKMAQAKANENQFKIKATGILDGTLYGSVLLPYGIVEVDGVGIKNGGKYYVDQVTHTFSNNQYQQAFTLIRNATN